MRSTPSTEADSPASARVRRGIGANPPATSSASGARSKPRRRERRDRGATVCFPPCRARCRRWWRRSRSLRGPRGVGFDWENAEQVLEKLDEELGELDEARRGGSQGENRGRDRRPAVRSGQPGALPEGGSGAGAAPDQRQVPRALRLHRAHAGRARQEARRIRTSRRWRRCGSRPSDDRDLAASRPRRVRRGADAAAGDLGLRRHRGSAAALFVVASKVGGQVFGAFEGGQMIGFLVAIPGILPDGRPYLHSHMLGVQPEYRDRGVGRRLKLAQREDALERGIELVEWTFDPLELKNAYFNIERLGAIVRRYVDNQYGVTAARCTAGCPPTAARRSGGCGRRGRRRRPLESPHAGRGRAHRLPRRYGAHTGRRPNPRARHPARQRGEASGRVRAGTGRDGLRAHRERRRVPFGTRGRRRNRWPYDGDGERVRRIEKKALRNLRRGETDGPEAA